MTVEIRDARREDAAFLAWVLLTAHRSHLERGTWDLVVDADEATCLRFLEHLAGSSTPHWTHFSTFLVAEVDGVPAAALCGYFDEEFGMPALAKALPEVNAAVGRTRADDAAGFARAGSIVHVAPEHEPGVWIAENVATRPEYRRRGLVDRLLSEIFDRGRQRGARVVDIGVLIGNDPAQRAYEKNGFKIIGEKRHPEFEAVYLCPGIRALSREL